MIRKAWTTPGRFSHHGKRWHYENVVIEPAPTQRPHPPLWVGAGNLEVIGNVARAGFNLLLDQLSTPEVSGQRIAAYRAARAAAGLPFDPMQVALTRGLHLAMNAAERDAQHELRAQFLENVRKLTVNPNGAASTMAVPQSPAEFRAQTEATTLIGTPEEIIMRLKAIEAQGIEYVLLMDVGGSIEALRRFAREVMPAFAGSSMVRAAA